MSVPHPGQQRQCYRGMKVAKARFGVAVLYSHTVRGQEHGKWACRLYRNEEESRDAFDRLVRVGTIKAAVLVADDSEDGELIVHNCTSNVFKITFGKGGLDANERGKMVKAIQDAFGDKKPADIFDAQPETEGGEE